MQLYDFGMLATAFGAVAFLVIAITEVTKNIGFLRRIPTDVQVIVLSLLLSVAALFAYAQAEEIVLSWYLIAAAVVASLLVSFVAMYGWATFAELWQRFAPPLDIGGEEDE